MRKTLNWIKYRYGNIPIVITENGIADGDHTLQNDVNRTKYHELYINEVLKGKYQVPTNVNHTR